MNLIFSCLKDNWIAAVNGLRILDMNNNIRYLLQSDYITFIWEHIKLETHLNVKFIMYLEQLWVGIKLLCCTNSNRA